MKRRQKKKLFNRKCGYRLVKLPRNFQTWAFQYYTGIGAVTYKRIYTEKIPDREKYLIDTRNVEARYKNGWVTVQGADAVIADK